MPPGFKRSRALWDATRDGGWRAWAAAICYELQPIRLSKANRKHAVETVESLLRNLLSLVLGIPPVSKSIVLFAASRSPKQWLFLGAVVSYYYFIRWVHETLDAGPAVLILTALTLIFTIGLGDDENQGGLSAYSVFNRGFEKLMGSVDADNLLAQHVGGGMMMNMNMNMNHRGAEDQAPPRPPRHEEQERRQPLANEGEANAEGENDDGNNNNGNNNDNIGNNNRARKSGKKARRRDLDQRRELRRQREAAMRVGLNGGGDDPVDALAMQRIIEEQIAAENNHG
ncbi:unnamed protein product [Pseudo-nitzschia multistriata]|uniref:SAYSvFN domain-containing protein n=1 Tax=Pseudo-nitzschia multistriata TaxID=183589 RepID=A0A448ZFG8_9STRA|nr:unnamed protein product [Pseudo-nitzschia multistriata]